MGENIKDIDYVEENPLRSLYQKKKKKNPIAKLKLQYDLVPGRKLELELWPEGSHYYHIYYRLETKNKRI